MASSLIWLVGTLVRQPEEWQPLFHSKPDVDETVEVLASGVDFVMRWPASGDLWLCGQASEVKSMGAAEALRKRNRLIERTRKLLSAYETVRRLDELKVDIFLLSRAINAVDKKASTSTNAFEATVAAGGRHLQVGRRGGVRKLSEFSGSRRSMFASDEPVIQSRHHELLNRPDRNKPYR